MRRHSVDVTSLDYVTAATSHAHRHHQYAEHTPVIYRSSSCIPPTSLSLSRSYEQELEEHLEQTIQRAVAAEQQLIHERDRCHQLMQKLNQLQTSGNETLDREQTTDSLESRLSAVSDDGCRQLARNVRVEDQLRLVTTDKTQSQQQQQQDEDGCTAERREVATQTAPLFDSSKLYQLLTSIALIRLDQLEIRSSQLSSRDPLPANQLRRTTSLPVSDIRRDDATQVVSQSISSTSQQTSPRHRSDDVVTKSRMTSWGVKRHVPSHLHILKKLQQTSGRRHADVIDYKRPIRVSHDSMPVDATSDSVTTSSTVDMTSLKSSSFRRLQQRRNGLTDVSFSGLL